jgi:ABC-2 type transport system permease protein
MIFCALFIALVIILEAGPVYVIFWANIKGVPITGLQWLLIIPSFLMVLLLSTFVVYKPMKMGVKALIQYE